MTSSARSAPSITRVVNLRRELYDVYIGRPGKGLPGPWGNPFRLAAESQRPAVLERYRQWLEGEIAAGRISKAALAELHGKRLGCFCKPRLCHGDILAQAADRAWRELHPQPENPADRQNQPPEAPRQSRQTFSPETKKQSVPDAPFSASPAADPPRGGIQIRPGADLFAQDCAAIVNTVNCVGIMGKGLALTVRNRYPACYNAYRAACRRGQVRPGRLHLWRNMANRPGQARWIVNFPTKDHWRQPSRLEWIDQGLEALVELIQQEKIPSLAVPPLGCGLGGLNWAEVEPLILHYLQPLADQGTRIVVCAPAKPGS